VRTVGKVAFMASNGNKWFKMVDSNGNRGRDMDGSRMWVRHPATGQKASETGEQTQL
jgi:hypothetical protein